MYTVFWYTVQVHHGACRLITWANPKVFQYLERNRLPAEEAGLSQQRLGPCGPRGQAMDRAYDFSPQQDPTRLRRQKRQKTTQNENQRPSNYSQNCLKMVQQNVKNGPNIMKNWCSINTLVITKLPNGLAGLRTIQREAIRKWKKSALRTWPIEVRKATWTVRNRPWGVFPFDVNKILGAARVLICFNDAKYERTPKEITDQWRRPCCFWSQAAPHRAMSFVAPWFLPWSQCIPKEIFLAEEVPNRQVFSAHRPENKDPQPPNR